MIRRQKKKTKLKKSIKSTNKIKLVKVNPAHTHTVSATKQSDPISMLNITIPCITTMLYYAIYIY